MSEFSDMQELGQKERGDIDGEMRLVWLCWAGCACMPVAAIALCHLVGAQIREDVNVREGFPLGMLEIILGIVGLVFLVVSYFLRKSFVEGRVTLCRKVGVILAGVLNRPAYLGIFRANVYLHTALSAAPAMFGLVLFVMGAGYGVLYGFAVVAALGVLWQRPRREELVQFCLREKGKQ